jgi:hypothetical protein
MLATAISQLPDADYDELVMPVPWGALVLAAFLTVFGTTCMVLAWLHFTQAILGKAKAVRRVVTQPAAAGSILGRRLGC